MNENFRDGAGDAHLPVTGCVDGNSGTSPHHIAKPQNLLAVQIKDEEGCSNASVLLAGFEVNRLNLSVQIFRGVHKELQYADQLVHLGLIDDIISIFPQAENLVVQDPQTTDVFLIDQTITLSLFLSQFLQHGTHPLENDSGGKAASPPCKHSSEGKLVAIRVFPHDETDDKPDEINRNAEPVKDAG